MLCPIIFNRNTIEITVHTSCYCGLKLTLCYLLSIQIDKYEMFLLDNKSVVFKITKCECLNILS